MIKIIAVLCSLSSPTDCHEQIVTTSDFADVTMQSCLMGAPQLAATLHRHDPLQVACNDIGHRRLDVLHRRGDRA